MDYENLAHDLWEQGFERVEKDDRLLDVFVKETAEKGIELWDKWGEEKIEFVRLHEKKNPQRFVLRRADVEEALMVPGARLELASS